MNQTIPSKITKLFWGDDQSELSFKVNKKYIAQTLLEKGDINEVKWLLTQINLTEIKSLLPVLKLSNKSAYFWQVFFN